MPPFEFFDLIICMCVSREIGLSFQIYLLGSEELRSLTKTTKSVFPKISRPPDNFD